MNLKMKKLVCILFLFSNFALAEPTQSFVRLAKKVRPSVVNISITQEKSHSMIELFPGYIIPFQQPELKGSGSGFVIDKSGLIVTNSHVVRGSDKIQVQFADDETFYPAKVLGSDSSSDIALLKINISKKLTPVVLGDSSKLEVGEWVAAIGNPHGYGHTMTKGIISAVKREIDELNLYPLLQTDASINPGNSGGPLVNLKGEVIGVNQAIVRGASGIGFAIPINNVKEVLHDLKNYGYVRKAFIGIHFQHKGRGGVLVENVVIQSPAHKAGIKAGDLIISFNGKKINKPTDLPKAVQQSKAGQKANIKVIRNKKTLNLKIIPQIFEGNKFNQAPINNKSQNIKGQSVSGGFQVVPAEDSYLTRFGHPGWVKHPIVSDVKKNSPAFRAGLRKGDMLFQINGAKVLRADDVKKTLKKSKRYLLRVLRYNQRSERYRILNLQLSL